MKTALLIDSSTFPNAPYYTLDLWRGLAVAWVVMFHASMGFVSENLDYLKNPVYVFSSHGALGVSIHILVTKCFVYSFVIL